MEALVNLGIDPTVMIAQAVNFFALLAILSFFVYKPIMRVLDERKDRIIAADKNAEKIEKQLKKVETDTKAEFAKAQAQSKEIIAHAKKSAKETEEQLVADAKVKVEQAVTEGRAQIAKERDEAAAAIQGEVAKVALLAAEKLIAREVNAKDQEKFVADAMKEIEKMK